VGLRISSACFLRKTFENAVGVGERSRLVDGTRSRRGDKLIGLASNGLHANGFSFIRQAFSNVFLKKHADEILRPTRIYVRPVRFLMRRVGILGMAHITGGGLYGNIPRVLPRGLGASILVGSWRVPRVFDWVREKSRASFREMHRVFNMGIGFVLVVRPRHALKCLRILSKQGVKSWMIGTIVKGSGVTFR